jgi:hypothetical protein
MSCEKNTSYAFCTKKHCLEKISDNVPENLFLVFPATFFARLVTTFKQQLQFVQSIIFEINFLYFIYFSGLPPVD